MWISTNWSKQRLNPHIPRFNPLFDDAMVTKVNISSTSNICDSLSDGAQTTSSTSSGYASHPSSNSNNMGEHPIFKYKQNWNICTNTNASTGKQHTASARHSRCFKILRGDSQLNLIMFVSSYLNTLEICQKLYMTAFYTLKVRKLRLFLLKKKQQKCINIRYFSSFFC